MTSYFKEHRSLGLRLETPPEEVQWLVIRDEIFPTEDETFYVSEKKKNLESIIYSRYVLKSVFLNKKKAYYLWQSCDSLHFGPSKIL